MCEQKTLRCIETKKPEYVLFPSRDEIHQAAGVIRAGGVVAYPTEHCYGLGCDPRNRNAVRKLLRIKQRAVHKGLILIGSSIQQFQPYIWPLKTTIRSRLTESWPGTTTWLVPARPSHSLITGAHQTIALRIPDHPVARKLCAFSGMAIVSTSANRKNSLPARSYRELLRMHLAGVDRILPGSTGGATNPSRIINAETGSIIRE